MTRDSRLRSRGDASASGSPTNSAFSPNVAEWARRDHLATCVGLHPSAPDGLGLRETAPRRAPGPPARGNAAYSQTRATDESSTTNKATRSPITRGAPRAGAWIETRLAAELGILEEVAPPPPGRPQAGWRDAGGSQVEGSRFPCGTKRRPKQSAVEISSFQAEVPGEDAAVAGMSPQTAVAHTRGDPPILVQVFGIRMGTQASPFTFPTVIHEWTGFSRAEMDWLTRAPHCWCSSRMTCRP